MLASGATLTVLAPDPARARDVLERAGLEGASIFAIVRDYAELRRDGARFDAALSTHGFLHGTAASVRAALAELAGLLVSGAPCFLTLGSTGDPRFGRGVAADAQTWAPAEGSEAGVPHAYFDRAQALGALGAFAAAEVTRGSAAGTWAHDPHEAERIVHWFVRAAAR